MDDQRVGAAFRAVRIKRGWTQFDVASRARISRGQVSLIERGHLDAVSLRQLRSVSAVLDIRIDVIARWRGGELDRLLSSRHAALQGRAAAWIRSLGDWTIAPEVSFAIYGERGWIDLLAWHAATRTLLVIEIKTDLVDMSELVGVVDRKVRLAPKIARDRGWDPRTVASWVIVGEGSTNRRRVAAFSDLLRTAFPAGRDALERWFASPSGNIAGLSFLSYAVPGSARKQSTGNQRVRKRKPTTVKREAA